MDRQLRADIICVLSILFCFATSAAAASFSNSGNLDASDFSLAQGAVNDELGIAASIYGFGCNTQVNFVESLPPGLAVAGAAEGGNVPGQGYVIVPACAATGQLTNCVEKIGAHEAVESCYGQVCDAFSGVQWQKDGFDLADCAGPTGEDFVTLLMVGGLPPPPPPPPGGECDINALLTCQFNTRNAAMCDALFPACFSTPPPPPPPPSPPPPSSGACNAYVLAVTGKCFVQ